VRVEKGIKKGDGELSKKVKLPSAFNLLSPEGWFLPGADPCPTSGRRAPLAEKISCPIFISAIWKIF